MRTSLIGSLAFFALGLGAVAQAQPARNEQAVSEVPSVLAVPHEAQPSLAFDAKTATRAYLATIPAAAKARSDSYFEGGYWLMLWNFVFGAAMAVAILTLRWSAGIRDLAERVTRFKWTQAIIYWLGYLLLTSILSFPLAVYQRYIREHQYGLATQSFGPWMVDQMKGFAVGLVLGAIIVPLLFAVARRLPRTWWLWGSLVTFAFLVFTLTIGPVFITPLFNKVTRLNDPKVTGPILSLARANGINAKDVFQIDASKQSKRISANVSGFAGTMRITLNDNLLRRGSPAEIQAVMGHEMGHYVLNHVYHGLVFFFVVIIAWFAFLKWSLHVALRRWGSKWRIRDLGDPAVLPLVALLGSIFFFVLGPVFRTYIRSQEYEADIFGLNASRQPDGFAQAAIHLSEYRKMEPGRLEEWLFYDHPSGRTRIFAAMRWKAENLRVKSTEASAR